MIRKFARYIFGVVFVITALVLTSCGGEQKKAQHLRIVTSFYPIYISTLNVVDGMDNIEVINLTDKRAGHLRDYRLTEDNMKTLATANILIVNGGGMEEFVERAKNENVNLKIIDASKDANIDWLTNDEGINANVWMDIRYNIEEVHQIAEKLAAIDSERTSNFQTNARLYEEKLLHLESEMQTIVKDLKTRDIVTFHDAFLYFAKEFNLNVVASVEATPGQNPSPQEVAEIVEQIRPLQRKVIFTEPQYSPEAAEILAYETGAQIFTLDPIVSGEPNKDAYIEAMRKNAKTLRDALQ